MSSFFGLNQFRNVAIYGCFFHEDWDKLSKEFEGSSSVVIADVDCTAGGKSKCEEATLAVTSVMMILATVRPLGDFDGNPFKKILIFLTWVERNLGSEAMNCVSQKQIVPALSHLQTPRNPKWHPSETVAKIFIDNMFWQNAPGSFQLMQTNIFLNMFSPGGYPWIPYHQIWRSRWSSGKFCWQKKDVDTEGTSKDGEVCKGNWILMDFGGKSLWHIQSKLPCFFFAACCWKDDESPTQNVHWPSFKPSDVLHILRPVSTQKIHHQLRTTMEAVPMRTFRSLHRAWVPCAAQPTWIFATMRRRRWSTSSSTGGPVEGQCLGDCFWISSTMICQS